MMAREVDKRSNVRVRALMATTGEGLVALDCEGRVRLMNEAAQEMLGRTRAEVIGEPLESLGVPELSERLHKAIDSRRMTKRTPFTVIVGERHLGCRMIGFQTATECGLALSLRDDTPLIRQQEQSEAILASTGDGLILFSPDEAITYANPAACEMLGTTAKKLVGRVVTPDALLGLEPDDSPDLVRCRELMDCTRIGCRFGRSALLADERHARSRRRAVLVRRQVADLRDLRGVPAQLRRLGRPRGSGVPRDHAVEA
jgi:PAS domain-containing protein